jgi:hypothetical protein
VPTNKPTDQRLLLGLYRLSAVEHLPDSNRLGRIAQTTALGPEADALTETYRREAERDMVDMMHLKHFPPGNEAVLMARAVTAAGYLACRIRVAAEQGGAEASMPAWNLLVAALTLLVLRYDTDDGRATLTALVDQISAEVAAL